MAKGGNSQRSNGSRFTKPYNVSNSFVTKVASRVSDYLGGWFGSPLKSSSNANPTEGSSVAAAGDTINKRKYESFEIKKHSVMPHTFLNVDHAGTTSTSAKRFKLSQTEKVDVDFPISPIPSTSGLYTNTVNHTFDLPKNDEFVTSVPGPSNLPSQRFSQTNNVAPSTSSTSADVKANGTTDNHSDSSESTSGCSSLVPQSDRLSQSAYACSSRKRNLEEKLKYARQLQQSRAAMFLNRSIPVSSTSGERKKPSFDVTAYGTASLDKSLLREKLINSPFYTGQTSYGGASAYRLSRNTFYSQRNPRNSLDRREGMPVEVKPSHHGSTESLTNMSHTAKKILEALEQFSTPVNDAKRIPVNRLTPLGSKRRRFDDLPETRLRLSTPISPLNPNAGPVITGLNVPTVPDLLKLKRLERIQNSTAAARQVAVEKQEYTLPTDITPITRTTRTGKMMTKLKDRDKQNVSMEKVEEVNLPKIPLPITTLPVFDFKLPPKPEEKASKTKTETSKIRTFKFSDPIVVSVYSMPERPVRKNTFTFSSPLNANDKKVEVEKEEPSPLSTFMSSDTVAKLKRKSLNDASLKISAPTVPAVSNELKTGSVMDFFKKSFVRENDEKKSPVKSAGGTWECDNCLIRNLNDSKICCGCKVAKVSNEKERTTLNPPKEKPAIAETKSLQVSGFGDKFKPPAGSWSCKECFVNNKESAVKCIACETPKQSAVSPKPNEAPPPAVSKSSSATGFGHLFKKQANQWECSTCMVRNKESDVKCVACETPKAGAKSEKTESKNTFGDLFKKQANQWECSTCMVRNKESETKCVACETPKPGTKPEKVESKFTFGTTSGSSGFSFGIDKASGVKTAADSSTFKFQSNGPQSESVTKPISSQFKAISTSVGVFTFGIPPSANQEQKESPPKTDATATTEISSSRFMVTSTSGSNLRKDEPSVELTTNRTSEDKGKEDDAKRNKNEISITDSSKTGSENFKPLIFGAANKSTPNSFFGAPKEENKEKISEPDKKLSTIFFGGGSNSLETVSSSTTDFSVKQKSPFSVPESGLIKPSQPFQFQSFGATKTTTPKSNINMPLDGNEAEVKPSPASTSIVVTTSSTIFGSANLNNSTPKISFGTTSTSSSGSGFMAGNLTSNSSPFSLPAQPFASSGFNSQPLTTPAAPTPPQAQAQPCSSEAATSFGIVPPSTEKPTIEIKNAFGNPAGSFGNVSKPFASTLVTSPNTEAPKPFGSVGSGSTVPGFRTNTTPFFGDSFFNRSNTADKPSQPFIFGSIPNPTATTSAPTSGGFTFGASKPSQFTFGQTSSSNFNFGSSAPTTNIFGSFGQPKADGSVGATTSPFGTSTSLFGQNSAPAAFETSAPKFEFGATPTQQQTAPAVFQFGATPAQEPTTAPAASSFSLSVPPKFNFTGAQTPTFTAEPPSTKEPPRKVIKAVRRTNPRRAN